MDDKIVPVEYSHFNEHRVTNASTDPIRKQNLSISDDTRMLSNPKSWLLPRLKCIMIIFGSFLPLVIITIIGILTVCFTSPGPKESKCAFKFVNLAEDWTNVRNRRLPIVLGDVNNDKKLDIIVSQRDDNKIHIFLGYSNGTFPTTSSISIICSSSPYSIVVNDFNNDTWLDIAIANHDENSIGVILSCGNGSFAKEITYTSGSSRPLSLTVNDFNYDNIPDIVVANDGTNSIGILFGYGDGTFAHLKTFSTGFDSHPQSIITGDFNNDTRMDIAVANAGTNNIGVFLGKSDGTFSKETVYSTHYQPMSLTIGDFNNDSRLDIVVANYANHNIGVFLGNGNGTFQREITYSTGINSYPISVVVSDFNKDNHHDIVVANSGSRNIGLFLGSGRGTFEEQRIYKTDVGSPQVLVNGYLNNDDWMDIVVSVDNGYNVNVFLGGPDKNFTGQSIFTTGPHSNTYSISAGYFNNDKQLDVVVANYAANNIGVFLGNGDGTFLAQTQYSTGMNSNPAAVAIGDFNNDLHMDIVVANYGSSRVGIFLGKGDGTFLDQIVYLTDSTPRGVAVGDFNNDSYMDIVVTHSARNNIRVFLGNGNATFSGQVTYLTDSTPKGVAIGDFNNDLHIDIVVVNSGSDNIGVFLGNGDGTFSSQITYRTGSSPYGIAVGDFNKDLHIDIVVTNSHSNSTSIFFGNGNGTFSDQTAYLTGSTPNGVVVGDFNNDTWLDISIANYNSDNISLLLGNKNGTFFNQMTYYTGLESQPTALTIGDFNSDNRLDIVVVNYYQYNIIIFIGSFNSPFTSPTTYSTGSIPVPYAMVTADLDLNNRLDIVVAHEDSGTIEIFWDPANGTSRSPTLYSTNYKTGLSSIAVGDFNSDHRYSIVVANRDSNTIGILPGFGNGSFGYPISYKTGLNSGPCSIAVGDFNNDNRLDIISVNKDANNIGLLLQYGTGAFRSKITYPTSSVYSPRSIAIGDFNNDTNIDVVLANDMSSNITVLLGNGDGSFLYPTTYAAGIRPYCVVVGDLNKDKILDIVVANYGSDNIGIFIGRGDGTFLDQIIYSTGYYSWPSSVAIADFNNDTQPDIAVGNRYGYNIGIFLGRGNGTFSTQVIYSTGYDSRPSDMTIADLNDDRYLDIVVTNTGTSNIGVFLGKGDGTFLAQHTYRTSPGAGLGMIAVGDFNNDKRLDVAASNYYHDNVSVLLGNGDGTFSDETTFSTGSNSGPYAVAIADFNRDGQLDIVVALSTSDTFIVLFGFGNGQFSHPSIFETGPASYPWNLVIFDFNKDNWLDIAILAGNINSLMIFLGERTNMFFVSRTFSIVSQSDPQSVAVGDFNNDNNLDIAITFVQKNSLGIFLGHGDGTFADQTIYSTGVDSYPFAIAVKDLNNDTRLDIVVTNSKSNTIGVFLGQENGTMGNMTAYSTGILSNPISVVILDFNNDNKFDIAVTNNGTNSIGLFYGHGNGTFLNQTIYSMQYNSRPCSIAVGDFDTDGWMDLAVATSGTRNIEILKRLC